MLGAACRHLLFPISFPLNPQAQAGKSSSVPAAVLLIFLQPRATSAGGNLPSLHRNAFIKKKEKEEEGEKPRSGWEAVSSYSERAVQVSYRRCTAHPRGARFTVLVQSAKQTDQLGDISKRSWNKVGEEGINSLQGGTFQLTHCQPRRIPSCPCKMPLMDFGLCIAAWLRAL